MIVLIRYYELLVVFVCAVVLPEYGKAADLGLKLHEATSQRVRGTYKHRESMGLEFDIRPDYVQMKTLNGKVIAAHMKLDKDTHYLQVADQGFLSHEDVAIIVPMALPKTLQTLRQLVQLKMFPRVTQSEFGDSFMTAIKKLRGFGEIQLFEVISKKLADRVGSGREKQITQPFHFLSLNLLRALDADGTSVDVIRETDKNDETGGLFKRGSCQDVRKTSARKRGCLGLCGKGCYCWRWVCGDCCWHRGCYEHDYCCLRRPYSRLCLLNVFYGQKCSSYGGYKKCKKWGKRKFWR